MQMHALFYKLGTLSKLLSSNKQQLFKKQARMEAKKEQWKYWCYACEAQFFVCKTPSICPFCESEAIEEAQNNEQISTINPSNFQTYQITPNVPQQPLQSQPQNNLIPQILQPILNMNPFLANAFSFGQVMYQMGSVSMQIGGNNGMQAPIVIPNFNGGGLFEMINSLMRNSSNLIATTPEQINRLQQVARVKECTICQESEDESEKSSSGEKKGYKLKCGHQFHKDCLRPWLQKTNTCPCCRTSL